MICCQVHDIRFDSGWTSNAPLAEDHHVVLVISAGWDLKRGCPGGRSQVTVSGLCQLGGVCPEPPRVVASRGLSVSCCLWTGCGSTVTGGGGEWSFSKTL